MKEKGTEMPAINYKGQEIHVRGGAWADEMNRCFYEHVDSVSCNGYVICRENGTGELFALKGTIPVRIVNGTIC